MSDSRADDARYAAERVMEPILRRWLAIDLEPVNLWSNAENAAVDLSYALEDASIIADHIRDLARLRSAPSLSPTVDDLEAYIDLALIRWVPGDDAGLARHIAESIHPRLVPVSPSVDPEEGFSEAADHAAIAYLRNRGVTDPDSVDPEEEDIFTHPAPVVPEKPKPKRTGPRVLKQAPPFLRSP